MSYWETYKARLNRNGANHADRLNVGREANFEKFLRQSPHYVNTTEKKWKQYSNHQVRRKIKL